MLFVNLPRSLRDFLEKGGHLYFKFMNTAVAALCLVELPISLVKVFGVYGLALNCLNSYVAVIGIGIFFFSKMFETKCLCLTLVELGRTSNESNAFSRGKDSRTLTVIL